MDSDFLMSLLPTWHSLIDIHEPELPCPAGADQSPDCFLAPFWEKSTERAGGLMFDSVLSSLASSPGSPPPNTSTDGFLIRELMGKPGSSGGFWPQTNNSGHLCKENAPKWGHSTSPVNPSLADLGAGCISGRTGQFTELAAMGKNPQLTSWDRNEMSNSREESSVSNPDKNPGLESGTKPPGEANRRKRKASPRGKEAGIEDDSGRRRVQQSDGGNGNENGSVRTEEEARGGSEENADGKDEKLKVKKTEVKSPEPPKDYIHVRARRGQATDSHSLAERVRREKISERMKILQDLVPGCNKVTGKALMLDEIINYVQSLQRQVEFLSMKLSSVNTSMDTNTSTAVAKDVFQPETTGPHQMLPLSTSVLYGQKDPAVNFSSRAVPQYLMDPLNNSQLPPSRAFGGDDLHSIVQMGYGQNSTPW